MGRETFATYLHWLYSSELIINTDRSLGAPEENDLAKAKQCNAKRSWLQLADLAIFADAYHDLNLHNAVVNSMVEAWEKFQISPNAGNIKLVWLVLPRHSKVRELYMDMVCSIEPTWFEYSKAVLHAEFIFDFMRNLLEERLARVQRPRVTQKTRCKYHEHNEKIPKCT